MPVTSIIDIQGDDTATQNESPSLLNAKNIVIFIIGISNGMQYSTIAASGINSFCQLIRPCNESTHVLSAVHLNIDSPMQYIIPLGDFTYGMFVIRNLHGLADTVENVWRHGRGDNNKIAITQIALIACSLITATPFLVAATQGSQALHVNPNAAAYNAWVLYAFRVLVSIDPAIRLPRRFLDLPQEVRNAWESGDRIFLIRLSIVVLANIGYGLILADDINNAVTLLLQPNETTLKNDFFYLSLTLLGVIGCVPLFFSATLLGLTQLSSQSPRVDPYPFLSLAIVLSATLGPLSRFQRHPYLYGNSYFSQHTLPIIGGVSATIYTIMAGIPGVMNALKFISSPFSKNKSNLSITPTEQSETPFPPSGKGILPAISSHPSSFFGQNIQPDEIVSLCGSRNFPSYGATT